jgi:hypothetical protein
VGYGFSQPRHILCIAGAVHFPASRFARVLILAGLLAVVPFAGTAIADTITLTTAQSPIGVGLNQGFYTSAGAHSPSSSIATTTLNSTGTAGQRSFFIFDLSLIGDAIIDSATLKVFNPSLTGQPFSVVFSDVTSPLANVKVSTSSVPIYNDLGTGVVFGSGSFAAINYVPFVLNSFAISAMNLQDGYFGIGAKLTSLNDTVFGPGPGGIAQAAQLVLETHAPDPPSPVPDSGATCALFGMAGAALAVLRRRI